MQKFRAYHLLLPISFDTGDIEVTFDIHKGAANAKEHPEAFCPERIENGRKNTRYVRCIIVHRNE